MPKQKIKHTPADLIGDSKGVHIGQIVTIGVNGNVEGEILVYPAIITSIKPSGAVSVAMFRTNFIEFLTNIPHSEKTLPGFFTVI